MRARATSRTRQSSVRAAAIAALVLSGVCLVLAQNPPQQPVFRAGTATVPVYASVTDDAGQFVLNLTAKDFVVRDNGKPQAITEFITDVQPITAIL